MKICKYLVLHQIFNLSTYLLYLWSYGFLLLVSGFVTAIYFETQFSLIWPAVTPASWLLCSFDTLLSFFEYLFAFWHEMLQAYIGLCLS